MKSGRNQVFNEINITPLTDIFLVLLIIMMVVAPMLEYRQLDLSVLEPGEVDETYRPEEDKTIHVQVDATGQLTVEDAPVATTALVDELRKLAAGRNEGGEVGVPLLIETHPDAPFKAMAQAMDAAQQAGLTQVSTAELAPPAPEPEPVQPEPKAKPAKGKKK